VRRIGHDVKRERRVGKRVDQPVIEHEARAMMPLLARLEHEHHGAGQAIARRAEQLCRADEHRDMRVMPARVHRAAGFGGKVEPRILEQGQRVHVAAQQHGAAIGGAAQDGDEAGGRRPLAKFERQPGERGLDLRQRLGVLQAQLGLAVNRAAKVDEVVEQGFGLGGPARHNFAHFFPPPNSCRPARSSMISSLPPPMALTRTSR
jgi:hypothetical protein